MASSSSCNNWVYDVFPSFSGEDVRITFLAHFLKELDRKLIIAFKDNEMKRGESLDPTLKQAIRNSKIAVVILSEKYASSTWCLDELLEIFKCKDQFGQLVIPVFYGLDPSHIRKQTGKFGEVFANTCLRKTEDQKTSLWRQSLTEVANITGYPSLNWPNEAKMIEAIANDILGKLIVSPSKDFEDFVGMDNHIAKMSVLLDLESQEVRMVGIWGTSGIGKTSIGRALFDQLSRHFTRRVYIDRAFVSKSMENYKGANSDDYNMKLHLQSSFLSEVLKKKDIMVGSLGAMEERFKHQKVLIVIDDLEDQMVLKTLVGQNQWFGNGSRIIVITKDKQFLRAHGIHHIYEVCLPSKELALMMFCRFCFNQNSPPDGFKEFALEIVLYAGNLPLGLKVLGLFLKGRDKDVLVEMLPDLRNRLDGEIEKTLRVSYDGLNDKDQKIFRHIACLFNGETVNAIKMLLADSRLGVHTGLENLIDKSLIHVRDDIVEMHSLLQELGKEIVRAQSDDPGEREFLMDSKDICDVLQNNTGTKNVLGIALDMDEINELHIHENAFKRKRMCNLLFLNIYNKKLYRKEDVRWHLEGFNHLPDKLKLLRFDEYPMKSMPSNFRPANLVKLQMKGSNLERLWEGVHALRGLKEIDLAESIYLKEIPDLSMATNLEKLDLGDCVSLVALPSSIKSLNKLDELDLSDCSSLETLPNEINLQSLHTLHFYGCSKLNIFPNISTNISELRLSYTSIDEVPSNLQLKNLITLMIFGEKHERTCIERWGCNCTFNRIQNLSLFEITILVDIPSSIQNCTQLENLRIIECRNLETLPNGINLKYLIKLDLRRCSRLKTFPNISTNVQRMNLSGTGIEEVPWWIENFSKLKELYMYGCDSLQSVSLHISKLKQLSIVDFSECEVLSEASWNDSSSDVAMETDNIHSTSPVLGESSSSFPENIINCFNYAHEDDLGPQPAGSLKYMMLTGEEVLPFFNHRTTGSSITNIPLFLSTFAPPFFKFKACAVVDCKSPYVGEIPYDIKVSCAFKNRLGNHLESHTLTRDFVKNDPGINLVIFECSFPLNEDNASPPDLVDIEFDFSYVDRNLCDGQPGDGDGDGDDDGDGDGDGDEDWDLFDPTAELIEWGIRVLSQENQLGHITESGDRDEENERSKKRIKGGDGFFNEVLDGYLLSRLKVPLPQGPSDSFNSAQSRGSSSISDSGDVIHEIDQKEHYPLLPDSVQEVMNFGIGNGSCEARTEDSNHPFSGVKA